MILEIFLVKIEISLYTYYIFILTVWFVSSLLQQDNSLKGYQGLIHVILWSCLSSWFLCSILKCVSPDRIDYTILILHPHFWLTRLVFVYTRPLRNSLRFSSPIFNLYKSWVSHLITHHPYIHWKLLCSLSILNSLISFCLLPSFKPPSIIGNCCFSCSLPFFLLPLPPVHPHHSI